MAKEPRNHLILIVTPDAGTFKAMQRHLGKDGFQNVINARTVPEAVMRVEERPPDLIISEVHMPDIDGWQLCRILKSEEYAAGRDIPIMLISATYHDTMAVRLAQEVGAFALLQMPYTEQDFLALVRAKLTPADVPPDKLRLLAPRKEILIADDDPDIVRILEHTLKEAGYSISIAADGEEAIRVIERDEPALVLLDYRMPKLDGMGVLTWVSESRPDLMVVMMTAHGDELLAVDIMRAGAYDYVKKPFDPAEVARICEKALNAYNMKLIHRQFGERIAELRNSETKFKALFDNASDGIVISDVGSGSILEANERFCQMFGYDLTELHSMKTADIFGPAFDERTGGMTESDKEPPAFQALQCTRKSGEEFYADVASRVVEYGGTTVLHSSVRDVTIRWKLQMELAETAKKLAQQNIRLKELDGLKTDFLNTVSHELRTPLTSIQWSLDSLRDFLKDNKNERLGRLLDILADDIARLSTLIHELLDLSRIEAGRLRIEKSRFDMCALLREVVDDLMTTAGSHKALIELELEDNLPDVVGDSGRVRQVVSNLVNNAMKYSREKPRIAIAARKVSKPRPALEVSVSDNGIGIAEEDLERVFDKFYRVRRDEVSAQSGTGLGLSIAKSIIEAHGGRIWAESTLGDGSTFTFTLPL